MVLLYLTTITLDIVLGLTIWTVTKTYDGVYYIIYGDQKKIELSDSELKFNKEKIDKLIEQNENQQIEIKKLTRDVNILTDYIKNTNN